MKRPSKPFVAFAVAAGPEIGFGHLVRARRLALALGVRQELILTGPPAARDVAVAFGWTVHDGADALAALEPDLLVIDDPSATRVARWTAQAERLDIPTVVIEDGRSLTSRATLVVDGNIASRPLNSPSRLSGPDFALIDPRYATAHRRPHRRTRILISLGGGAHARRFGRALAAAVVSEIPGVAVDIAAGFTGGVSTGALPAGCRWVSRPDGLVRSFSGAAVAVVAGGVSLHEACAAGCPAVAVAVVPGQRAAIRAAAARSAVIDAGLLERPAALGGVAQGGAELLSNPTRARLQATRAARLVDGRGLSRVVRRIQTLVERDHAEGWRDAA